MTTILERLRADGPQTVDELAERTGKSRADVRAELASLVFRRETLENGTAGAYNGEVTCDAQGRYQIGDPTPLIEVRA